MLMADSESDSSTRTLGIGKGEKFPSMMKYFANLGQPACGTANQVNRFFDGPSVYPEYLTDADVVFADNPLDLYEADLSYSGGTIYRLREGIERFFISDINNAAASNKAQSEISVMWDSCWTMSTTADGYSQFNHVPGGANVLFMDGHVKFIKYPSSWPVCVAYVEMMKMMRAPTKIMPGWKLRH